MRSTIALFAFLGGVVTADLTNPYGSDLQDWLQGVEPSSALCSTDSECMEFCSLDDPDCDGGPEPVVEPTKALAKLSCWPVSNRYGSYVRCEVLE